MHALVTKYLSSIYGIKQEAKAATELYNRPLF